MTQTLDLDWMTLRQAADYLQCCPATVMRYVAAGKLEGAQPGGSGVKHLRGGGRWRIKTASIEKLLRG